MTIDPLLRSSIIATFQPLARKAARSSMPAPRSLAAALEAVMPSGITTSQVNVDPQVASMFCTAAVEMWLRAVHSFLISTALTDASPIWSSVAGYYSSHYSIRAIAHLLGYFQLFRRKRIVSLLVQKNLRICTFDRKDGNDREHRFYWKAVRSNPHFSTDPLFTENISTDPSDVSHRDFANYVDHIARYPSFLPLSRETLINRVQRISSIEFTVPPIPSPAKFPDVDSVQIVAYHRMIKFRRFLDEALGANNNFWRSHRMPSWTNGITDFQLVEAQSTGVN